jgi:acyl-CoA reductase-like NAD-dependent aldehyde dehydrogenase
VTTVCTFSRETQERVRKDVTDAAASGTRVEIYGAGSGKGTCMGLGVITNVTDEHVSFLPVLAPFAVRIPVGCIRHVEPQPFVTEATR